MNENENVMTIQWNNKPYIGEIQHKRTNMKYNQQLYCIQYTNISIQKPLNDAQEILIISLQLLGTTNEHTICNTPKDFSKIDIKFTNI